MCGICGYLWDAGGKGIELPLFDRMTDSLSYRGPDDRGVFYARPQELGARYPGVALGHRRLSIIDLSERGRQPMSSSDGKLQLVCNGEIYNYIELRAELEKKGYRFRTQTDTEVVIALYREYGEDFVTRLNGMFALALYDIPRNKLILARDRFGKKPLFYRVESKRIVFASELNTLLLAPDIPKELDLISLDEYLTYMYVPYPRSIYRGIKKLPPASIAVWTAESGFSARQYWQPDFDTEEDRPYQEWIELLRERLETAVKIRMRSDVPIGAFLSGGIDSTITVGLMQKFSSQKINTYSIGFDQKLYDETPIARRTAERFGTEHHELFIDPNIEILIPMIASQYGEPFADSSAIPCRLMCESVRRDMKVAFTGDGGDEFFAGYARYRAVGLSSRLDRFPRSLRRLFAGIVRTVVPKSKKQRGAWNLFHRFAEALPLSPEERYWQWMAAFNRQRHRALYTPELTAALNEYIAREEPDYDDMRWLTAAMARASRRDPVTQALLADVQTYLPCDILTQVDIASMACGLEVRSPFLDDGVADLAFRMPSKYKISAGRGKMIMRDAFREFITPEIDRRPKTGLVVPLYDWIRGALKGRIEEILLSPSKPLVFLRTDTVRQILDEHLSGAADNTSSIWAIVILVYFIRESGLA